MAFVSAYYAKPCFASKRKRDTHDAISHEMPTRGHPPRHFWGLHKRAEIWVAHHEVRGDRRAVRGVACRSRVIVATDNDLLYRALDAVRRDDEICMDDLAGGECDGGPAGGCGVWLDGADCGAETDVHARRGASEAEQEGVVVGAVDVVVRRAVLVVHGGAPVAVPNALARVVPPKDEGLWDDGCRGECLSETPAEEEARLVRRDLNASADVAESRGRLEERYAVAALCEAISGGEPAKACTDDNDVEGEWGAATIIEWWDLLDGCL